MSHILTAFAATVCILVGIVISSALLFVSVSVVIAACVFVVCLFIAWLIGYLLQPRVRSVAQ